MWIALAWVAGVAVAILGLSDAVDPAQEAYGANYPGDLVTAIAIVSIVAAVLYGILCPAPERAPVVRSAIAVCVAFATVGAMFVTSSHAGAILGGTFVWTIGVFVATVLHGGAVAASAIAARLRQVT